MVTSGGGQARMYLSKFLVGCCGTTIEDVSNVPLHSAVNHFRAD